MATMSKFIALFLFLAFTLVYSQDVTTFTHDTFSPKPNGDELIYEGGAHVPEGSGFVRLTATDPSGVPVSWNSGRVVHSWPVVFWEESPARQATFETTIKFRVTPSAQGAADGLAFYIAPANTLLNDTSSGANLGIFTGPTGTAPSVFAVEFDNYVNSWDPSFRHIGIDIESRVSKTTTEFDSATGELVTARINYNPNTKSITVVATSGTKTASLSYEFDLKTILPQSVEVGISAATGQDAAHLGVHDLVSWYFTSSLVADSVNNEDEAYIRQIV